MSEPKCYKHCNKKKCPAYRNRNGVALKVYDDSSKKYPQLTIQTSQQKNVEHSFLSPNTSKNQDVQSYVIINSNEEKYTQTIVKATDCTGSCSNIKTGEQKADHYFNINISTYSNKLKDISSKSNSTLSIDNEMNSRKSFPGRKRENYLKNTLKSETPGIECNISSCNKLTRY